MKRQILREFDFKIITDLQVVKDFIVKSPLFNILQTPEWRKVKDGWKSEFLGFTEKGKSELLGCCLILTRTVVLGFKMCYIPRGIIMDYSDNELLVFVISKLKEYGKNKKALFVKFDPLIKNDEDGKKIIDNLEALGVVYRGETKEVYETIQFRFDATINKENYDYQKLSKKFTSRLKKSKASFSEIKIGRGENIEDFMFLMHSTEKRKHIKLRDKDYFEKILKAFPNNSTIVLVYTNVEKALDKLNNECLNISERIKNISNEKKKAMMERQLFEKNKEAKELSKLMQKYGKVVPSAGNLIIYYGEKSYNMYAGMNGDFKKYFVSYLAWDESIKYSFQKGALTHDMGGVESDGGGLRSFKRIFNPCFEEYVGEVDIVTNRIMYFVVEYFYRIRKVMKKYA